MLKLIKFLFTGSWHECKYIPVDHHKTSTYSGSYSNRPHTITHTYVTRCECGNMRSKRVEV